MIFVKQTEILVIAAEHWRDSEWEHRFDAPRELEMERQGSQLEDGLWEQKKAVRQWDSKGFDAGVAEVEQERMLLV